MNAVHNGRVLRAVKWLRDRFSKWKSDVKKALCENAKQNLLRLTGGGEASFTNLNETDNLMASLLVPEEYAGQQMSVASLQRKWNPIWE